MADKMTLHFTHPRSSEAYPAQVSPACPAKIAIEQLCAPATGPFLEQSGPGRAYQLILARTGAQLAPSQTFGQIGAVDGDVLQVEQVGQGA